MDRTLHLAAGKPAAALRFRIVSAVDLHYIAFFILDHFIAFDEISMLQTHLIAREQAEILAWRVLHEVLALNINFPGERDLAMAHFRVLAVVLSFEQFGLPFRVVRDYDFKRVKDSHRSWRLQLQILADEMIQHLQVNFPVGLGYACFEHESLDRFRRYTAAAQAGYRRH